jgi:hypothetical protein
MAETNGKKTKQTDRVLGDEWLDWNNGKAEGSTVEGKRTFLLLSFIVLILIILLALLFLYLVLPRFEQYGRTAVIIMTAAVITLAAFLLTWYIFLLFAALSKKNYLFVCLEKGTNLLTLLFPFVARLAASIGISKDRLGHSFIQVSNTLVRARLPDGPVLVLLPRCLKKELKQDIGRLCNESPNVILHTAPGGNVARQIIRDTEPKAIVAVACERDLVSGIQDVAPRIPVIGICNIRPAGPCKDTSIDLEEFCSALAFFCKST